MNNMLKNKVNPVKVYPDEIPEGVALPAIAYLHNTNTRGRDQKGKTSGKQDTWRVIIAGDDRASCDTIQQILETLDGTSNNDFQGVHIISVSDEPVSFKNTNSRTFIDFRTYDR